MTDISSKVTPPPILRSSVELGPTFLIYLHILVCCVSLVFVADFYSRLRVAGFDEAGVYSAVRNTAIFALVSALFTLSRFSFGYVLGFYFYTIVLGYLWLVEFSHFHYDRPTAIISVFFSALAFLLPALFITSPIKRTLSLSTRALDSLLSFILILTAGVLVCGAFYNLRLVGLSDIYKFRNELEFPVWLGYAMGATSNALLPFAFACFVERRNAWRATIVLLFLLLFYPITLSKGALFAPAWLLFLMLLSRFCEIRSAVVLSLSLPVSAGVVLALLFKSGLLSYDQIIHYFGAVNFRMVAFPSIAFDIYNDFFSTHAYTYFCQISFLKALTTCPYSDPLAIIMAKAYQLGNFNASLFVTEGIASVGLMLAPLAVFACGLVISFANRLSAGLPPRFVLLSGGILLQTFLNVPLTATLLTYGAAMLFLLWYLTPRSMFEQEVG